MRSQRSTRNGVSTPPVWSVEACAALDVTTDATQVAEDLSGGLAFPLEGIVRMMGDVQIGTEGGVRIEGDADGMRALVQLTNSAQADGLLGFLLGLLLGSVLGIYPFQEVVARGEPRAYFAPTMLQVLAAVGLVLAGYGVTRLVDRVGAD